MKSRQELEQDLINPGSKKFDNILNNWFDTLKIIVFVDKREQTPWTSDMIGYETRAMPTKSEIGEYSTGDYQFIVDCPNRPITDCFGSLLVERKSKNDLYNTLLGYTKLNQVNPRTGKQIKRQNRDRFDDEIKRFKADSRFDQFIIIVECGMLEWLSYVPPGGIGASLNSRLGTLASLQAKGVNVFFAGSRRAAARYYGHCIRQNVLKNWDKFVEVAV